MYCLSIDIAALLVFSLEDDMEGVGSRAEAEGTAGSSCAMAGVDNDELTRSE